MTELEKWEKILLGITFLFCLSVPKLTLSFNIAVPESDRILDWKDEIRGEEKQNGIGPLKFHKWPFMAHRLYSNVSCLWGRVLTMMGQGIFSLLPRLGKMIKAVFKVKILVKSSDTYYKKI